MTAPQLSVDTVDKSALKTVYHKHLQKSTHNSFKNKKVRQASLLSQTADNSGRFGSPHSNFENSVPQTPENVNTATNKLPNYSYCDIIYSISLITM